MTIYKVRLIDNIGKEVAEFGFFQDQSDAVRRRLEVSRHITQPGTLDIRKIEVQDSSEHQDPPQQTLDYYTLKEDK